MKTLVVSYLPRGERSRTAKVLEEFLTAADGEDLEILDLVQDAPDFFLADNLLAYYERDYAGLELPPEKNGLLTRMDEMTAQLVACEALVLATPMFNFSVPAIVKAWLDSVMLKGKTWDVGQGGYEGMLGGRRALVIYSCGGVYEGETASYNCLESLLAADFGFMGLSPVEFVAAQGLNMCPGREEEILAAAYSDARDIAVKWRA